MAHTINFIRGGLTIDLDSLTSNVGYKTHLIGLATPPPDLLTHEPDYGESRIIRHVDNVRSCSLTMTVFGSDNDDVLAKIGALRRFLALAFRAHEDGDHTTSYLRLKRDSTTYSVDHEIMGGYVDDSGSHLRGDQNTGGQVFARDIQMNVYLTASGQATSVISYSNDLASSPHFVEDSDGDGLADGWSVINTPTTTLDTAVYLGNTGQSQKVVTDNSTNEGIECDIVTAVQSTTAVAFVWLHIASGGDDVTVELEDGSDTQVQEKTMSEGDAGGVSDLSLVDSSGNTWYRVVVSGTNSAAANWRLLIRRKGADANVITTFYCAYAYLEKGTTTAPLAGWASTNSIENRPDVDSSNEDQINYIDVALLPGDMPALMRIKGTATAATGGAGGSTADTTRFAVSNEELALISRIHYIASSSFTTVAMPTNGAWNDDAASAGALDGSFDTFTASGGIGNGATTYTSTNAAAIAIAKSPKRLMVYATSNDTAATIQATISVNGRTMLTSEAVAFGAANYALFDLGVFDFRGMIYDTGPGDQVITITVLVAAVPDTKVVSFDGVLLLPAQGENITLSPAGGSAAGDFWIDGISKRYQIGTTGNPVYDLSRVGRFRYLEPGQLVNRIIWAHYDKDKGGVQFDDTFSDITIDILPRVRHLYGVF